MLGKLMKYDLKGSARTMLPLFAALLIMTIINTIFVRINFSLDNTGLSMLFGLSMFLYVAIIVAIAVMSLVIIIQRFYKNLFTDEGYLMHTLPVAAWQHIVAKLVIALLWALVCTVVIILSILIISLKDVDFVTLWIGFTTFMSQAAAELGVNFGLYIFEGILLFLTSTISSILMIYLAIAIGQLFNSHKIIGAFGAYIAITMVLQVLATVLLLIFGNVVGDAFDALVASMSGVAIVHLVMIVMLVLNLISCVVFFIGTNYLMKNKLNLE